MRRHIDDDRRRRLCRVRRELAERDFLDSGFEPVTDSPLGIYAD